MDQKPTIELNGEFHKAFGIAELTEPGIPDFRTVFVRVQLIQGELAELAAALAAQDYCEVLDALTDLDYVVDGTFRTYGIARTKQWSRCVEFPVVGITNQDKNLNVLAGLQMALGKFLQCVEARYKEKIPYVLNQLQFALDFAWRTLGFGPVRYEAYCEVHRSNMTKLDVDGKPIISPSGKIKKGPNFQEPDLKSLILKLAYSGGRSND